MASSEEIPRLSRWVAVRDRKGRAHEVATTHHRGQLVVVVRPTTDEGNTDAQQ